MISEAALIELKQRQPCYKVAAKWVSLRKKGKGYVGPCPLHSKNPSAKDSTAFECNDNGWVCAFCEDGGDVIKLVQLREQLDFTGAIGFLGGTTEPSPERAKQIEEDQRKRRETADKEQNEWRRKAIASAQNIWQRGQPWRGTPVETYLRELRGLTTLPDDLDLRYAPQLVYCYGDEVDDLTGEKRARVIHRGPAMLAQIVDPPSGEFRAVHRTYLDLLKPKGKAVILDPETLEPLKVKKGLGSKQGNIIRLAGDATPRSLVMGEGIETTLSVWLALHAEGRDDEGRAFWCAVDLPNMGGKSVESVRHPTLKSAKGRALGVPGPQPDLADPGIAIPAGVTDVLLLGDGDSDRFTTQCAIARASARFAREGRSVRAAWAPDGMDFNDMIMGRETSE
jgi:hypothetical protein